MARLTRISEMRRQRHHGAVQHVDRRELERAGWRTTLDYRENHVRGRDGRLKELRVEWHAEAEHDRPGAAAPLVVSARSSDADRVWAKLRYAADVATVELTTRPPELPPGRIRSGGFAAPVGHGGVAARGATRLGFGTT